MGEGARTVRLEPALLTAMRVPAWRHEARRRVVAFDAGLWTIDDNLRIRVAQSDLIESILPGGSHFKLSDLHGRRLSFSPQATLRPDPARVAWHRREVFAHD